MIHQDLNRLRTLVSGLAHTQRLEAFDLIARVRASLDVGIAPPAIPLDQGVAEKLSALNISPADLRSWTASDLVKQRGIGVASVAKIREWLTANGLSLRGE